MKLSRAFSLIEVMAVAAITAVLLLFSLPAFEQMVKGSRVTIAGRTLVDELSLAQQTALSRNLPVEVRFYKLPPNEQNPETATPAVYRAFQTFLNDGSDTSLGKIVCLPPGIVIFEDEAGVAPEQARSSILLKSGGPLTVSDEQPASLALPTYGRNYRYRSFRFKGNGETDMSDRPAFLTLVSQKDPPNGTSGLPANFVTVQIDPVNGRARSFRP